MLFFNVLMGNDSNLLKFDTYSDVENRIMLKFRNGKWGALLPIYA